jgi:hypothetical protein
MGYRLAALALLTLLATVPGTLRAQTVGAPASPPAVRPAGFNSGNGLHFSPSDGHAFGLVNSASVVVDGRTITLFGRSHAEGPWTDPRHRELYESGRRADGAAGE